ncbi:MAG TPA: EI24 domain-containing protein [Burkholderiales bacterium]|nr:EI24 domain-containing protein [Burkholderiales bacterium]
MPSVFGALMRALRDTLRPRILAVLFLPMVGAIVLWSVLGWFFWDGWIDALRTAIDGTAFGRWLVSAGAAWFVGSMSALLVLAVLLPAVLVTAMLITEVIAMPVIVSIVEREYPGLAKRGGGSIIGSVLNALGAVVIFGLLWIATLPLWFTGIGALVVPVLNSAYLNQRLFRYDALADFASRDEYREIVTRVSGRLYALGVLLAPTYYVPFVNLAAPVVSGLAFTHFCLGELARSRALRGEV